MNCKSETKPDASSQLKRFKEATRQLGCDEDKAAFDEKLKVIGREKPKDRPPEPPGSNAS